MNAASSPDTHPLLMLRSLPDLAALTRWAAATGQRALREDPGYALHAALRATLGSHAPKPFALLERPGSQQLIGYTRATESALNEAVASASLTDPLATQALGLNDATQVVVKLMPSNWVIGQRLSFETRVAPVVRSRTAQGGTYPEIDAAFHPAFAGDDLGNRELAHGRWLARELAREGAAQLLSQRTVAFSLSPIARRTFAADNQQARRKTQGGLLPDLTARGQLQVQDPEAFAALLTRGLGRHRSFGYGCLLLAPPGAWT
jgi:CRISPR system Cascade subunit CasE